MATNVKPLDMKPLKKSGSAQAGTGRPESKPEWAVDFDPNQPQTEEEMKALASLWARVSR